MLSLAVVCKIDNLLRSVGEPYCLLVGSTAGSVVTFGDPSLLGQIPLANIDHAGPDISTPPCTPQHPNSQQHQQRQQQQLLSDVYSYETKLDCQYQPEVERSPVFDNGNMYQPVIDATNFSPSTQFAGKRTLLAPREILVDDALFVDGFTSDASWLEEPDSPTPILTPSEVPASPLHSPVTFFADQNDQEALRPRLYMPLATLFSGLRQEMCTRIAIAWIKILQPNKRATHSFKRGIAGRPPWWPSNVRHRHPSHLLKPERLRLLQELALNPDIQIEKLISVALEQVSKQQEHAIHQIGSLIRDLRHSHSFRSL